MASTKTPYARYSEKIEKIEHYTQKFRNSAKSTVVFFTPEDIDVSLKHAQERGALIVVPKISIGGYTTFAIFEDLEGNRIGLRIRENLHSVSQ